MGPTQHDTADAFRRIVGRPQRRARGERVAEDHGRPRVEMVDQGQRIATDRLCREVSPLRRRLTEAAHIHRDDAVACRLQLRAHQPVLRA